FAGDLRGGETRPAWRLDGGGGAGVVVSAGRADRRRQVPAQPGPQARLGVGRAGSIVPASRIDATPSGRPSREAEKDTLKGLASKTRPDLQDWRSDCGYRVPTPAASASSSRTSSSVVCEKSSYQMPTAWNGSGSRAHTVSSARSS